MACTNFPHAFLHFLRPFLLLYLTEFSDLFPQSGSGSLHKEKIHSRQDASCQMPSKAGSLVLMLSLGIISVADYKSLLILLTSSFQATTRGMGEEKSCFHSSKTVQRKAHIWHLLIAVRSRHLTELGLGISALWKSVICYLGTKRFQPALFI